MYQAATPLQRFGYRFTRHWLTITAGYFFIFAIGLCLKPLLMNPRRNWEAALSLIVHYGIFAALGYTFGWEQAFLSFLFPVIVACGMGSYLFYAQHSFPEAELRGRQDWEFTAAALYSSSMIDMSWLMHWLTGNIGYHHVHHLNSMIPFYRLPEAMAAVPELASPRRTSLKPRDVLSCLSLHLWDSEQKRMITYREARRPAEPTALSAAPQ
jgi:omega-6 fatty acid desaturase (delta-12 desaturase)